MDYEEKKCTFCHEGKLRMQHLNEKLYKINLQQIENTLKILKPLNSEKSTILNRYKTSLKNELTKNSHDEILKYCHKNIDTPLTPEFRKQIIVLATNELQSSQKEIINIIKEVDFTKVTDTVSSVIKINSKTKGLPSNDSFLKLQFEKNIIPKENYIICCTSCNQFYPFVGYEKCIFCNSDQILDLDKKITENTFYSTGYQIPGPLLSFLKTKDAELFSNVLYSFINTKFHGLHNSKKEEYKKQLASTFVLFRKKTTSPGLSPIQVVINGIAREYNENFRKVQPMYQAIANRVENRNKPANLPPIRQQNNIRLKTKNASLKTKPFSFKTENFSLKTEDPVSSTVYAPAQAEVGNSFLIQVFAHTSQQASQLDKIAKGADDLAKKRISTLFDKRIQRGTALTFSLTIPDLVIDEAVQSRVWRGDIILIQFGVTIPASFQPKDVICSIILSEKRIPVGHMKFKMNICAAASPIKTSKTEQIVCSMLRYKQAFISYASADRKEVLKRTQMLNSVKLKFFQDLLTLEPGDRWADLIYKYINESDVFFLFWSTAASQSEWVRDEVLHAIKRKGGKDDAAPEIIPIIIEGPPPAKPPPELSFLHFNDKFMYFINPKTT